MSRFIHKSDCRWERTTIDECEYKKTHNYCPHPEHFCSCVNSDAVIRIQLDIPTERAAELDGLMRALGIKTRKELFNFALTFRGHGRSAKTIAYRLRTS